MMVVDLDKLLPDLCRWVDNIEMDLREIGWDGVYWIDRAQDMDQWRSLVSMVLNLRVP
jgi:hypothetical protein